MRNIYRSLLLILATATQKELARYISYLKAENKILLSRLPERVLVEPNERRRPVRLAAKLGRALDELVTIVHPGIFLKHTRKAKLGAEVIMHDRDTKFARSFDASLEKAGLRVQWTAYRSPNTCAFVERFIQTLGQECLDHFVVLGERPLNYLFREFLEHYHLERPHQSLDNKTLVKKGYRRKTCNPASTPPLSDLACKTRLGGLLKHYYRKAA